MTPTCAATQRAELRDQLLGQTIAEVLLAAVFTEIAERQHHEPRVGGSDTARDRDPTAIDAAPDEPITTTRHRLDEPRLVGIVAERSAQALDGGVQAVLEVDEGAVRPETMTQLVARDDFARALEHEPENLERLILKAHQPRAVA